MPQSPQTAKFRGFHGKRSVGSAHQEGKPFYEGLIAYITSGPVVKMVISGEGAVAKCRSLMGATNPAEAAPGTIRAGPSSGSGSTARCW